MSGRSTDGPVGPLTPSMSDIESLTLKSNYIDAEAGCRSILSSSDGGDYKQIYLLSRILLGSRQFTEALSTIDLALAKAGASAATGSISKEDLASIHSLKAQILMYLGRHEESLRESEIAIHTDGKSVSGYVFKSIALKHLYRDDDSINASRAGVELVRSGELHGIRDIKLDLEKSFLARLCQEYDIAIKYANYVIAAAPEYASGYVHLGVNFLLKYISEGKEADDANLVQSRAALDRALELSPRDSVAMYYKGVSHEVEGKAEEALALYHKAAETSSGYSNAVLALVNLHMNRGETDHAISHIQELIELNPRSEESLLSKAKVLGAANKNAEALVCLDELIELNPINYYYHYRKALVLAAQGKQELALEECDHALALKHDSIDTLYHRAVTLAALKDYPSALATISRIIELKQEFALAYEARGFVLGEIVNESSSEGFAYWYSKNNSSSPEVHKVVVSLLGQKKYLEAEKAFYNKITAANSESLEFESRAQAKIDNDDFDGAIEDLTEAIRINSDFALARYKLVELLTDQGRCYEAEAIVHQITEVTRDYFKALDSKAKLPHVIEIEEEAIASHDEAIRLAPENPTVFSSKATSLAKFHRVDEAEECTSKAAVLLTLEAAKDLSPEQHEYNEGQSRARAEVLKQVSALIFTTKQLNARVAEGTSHHRVTGEEVSIDVAGGVLSSTAFLAAASPSGSTMGRFASLRDLTAAAGHTNEGSLSGTVRSNFSARKSDIASNIMESPRAFRFMASLEAGSIDQTAMPLDNRESRSVSVVSQGTVSVNKGVVNERAVSSTSSLVGDVTYEGAGAVLATGTRASMVDVTSLVLPGDHIVAGREAIISNNQMALKALRQIGTRAAIEEMQTLIAELKGALDATNARLTECNHARETMEAGLTYALAHDAGLARVEAELKIIEADSRLKDYYSGYVRTFQKVLVGYLARMSGEVEGTSLSIPGLEFVPLPPVVDECVKAFNNLVGFVDSTVRERAIKCALKSIPDPQHLMTVVIQQVASHLALVERNADIIAEHKSVGFMKVIAFFKGANDFIFGRDEPSVHAEMGSADAMKLIASLRAGKVSITSLTDDSSTVRCLVSQYSTEQFNRELPTFRVGLSPLAEGNVIDTSTPSPVAVTELTASSISSTAVVVESEGSALGSSILDLPDAPKVSILKVPSVSETSTVVTRSPEVSVQQTAPAHPSQLSWWQSLCCCYASTVDQSAHIETKVVGSVLEAADA